MEAIKETRAAVINDDDLYVIDLSTHRVVEQLGSGTVMALAIRGGSKWGVQPGQALVRGMQARALLGAEA